MRYSTIPLPCRCIARCLYNPPTREKHYLPLALIQTVVPLNGLPYTALCRGSFRRMPAALRWHVSDDREALLVLEIADE